MDLQLWLSLTLIIFPFMRELSKGEVKDVHEIIEVKVIVETIKKSSYNVLDIR